jgi:hypothetical protein
MSTAPASAARTIDDWDQGRVWLAAEHEAAHVAAAWHFAWRVDEVAFVRMAATGRLQVLREWAVLGSNQ